MQSGSGLMLLCSKRFQSLTGQESLSINAAISSAADTTLSVADLESLKQEILTEVRREINQAKQEIIDGQSQIYDILLFFVINALWIQMFTCLLPSQCFITLVFSRFHKLMQ